MPQLRLVVGPPAALEDALLGEIAAVRASSMLAPVDVLVGGVLQRPYLQRRSPTRSRAPQRPLLDARRARRPPRGGGADRRGTQAAHRDRRARPRRLRSHEARAGTSSRSPKRPASPRRHGGSSASCGRRRSAPSSSPRSPRRRPSPSRRPTRWSTSTRATWPGAPTATTARTRSLSPIPPASTAGAARLRRLAARRERPRPDRAPRRADPGDVLPAALGHGRRRRDRGARLLARSSGRGSNRARAGRGGNGSRPRSGPPLRAAVPARPDDTIELVSAPDPLSETREAARTCLDWARAGIAFREMASPTATPGSTAPSSRPSSRRLASRSTSTTARRSRSARSAGGSSRCST